MIEEFKIDMMKRYVMSTTGLLHHFLGMKIYQDGNEFISQMKYAKK